MSDSLPGLPFPGPRWSYPTKDQVADYLAAYAERFALPVRTLARVDRLEAADGKYVLRLGADRIVAENVVVATGTFGRTPSIPDFALDLDPSIRQLHSSEYRRPEQLKPGPVLVVGASHSGTDIAFEVAANPPDGPGRSRPRPDASTAEPLERPAGLADLPVPRTPRDHPAHAHRAAKPWTRFASTVDRCCG